MRAIVAHEAGAKRERIRQIILGSGLECDAADCVSYADLPFRILQGPADLILFGVGPNSTNVLPMIRQTVTQTKAPVVAVGASAHAEEILQTLRSGAAEYLHEEDLGEGLLAVLGKMNQAGTAALHWGQILAVIAAKSGVGVTTVASNVAFALAAHHPRRVALAELGMQVPELALNLDLEPPHDLGDLNRSERLDTTLVKQALVEHGSQLQLLVHQSARLQTTALARAAMRQLLVLLRTMFEYTVLDLGHSSTPSWLAALKLATKVVLVISLDVPTLRLSRRFLRDLEDAGVGRGQITVVANRYGQRKQFHWKQAQDALGSEIQEWIPDDSGLMNEALNLGKPLVSLAPRASLTRTFDQLAMRLNGQPSGRLKGLAG